MRKLILLCVLAASICDAGVLGIGKGGGVNSANAVPVPAQQAGFTDETFNTTTIGSATGDWQPSTFFGCNTSPLSYTQNSNGTIYLSGYTNPPTYTGCSGANLDTAVFRTGANPFNGLAFGGGFYAQATISFTGQGSGPYNNGGPAFWTKDVEQSSQSGTYTVSWPTGGCVAWSSGTAYAIGNCATSGGNSYFAITANTNFIPSGCPAWSSSTAYVSGNCVTLNGGVYYAIASSTDETPPNATYWTEYWLISTSYNNYFEIDILEYDCGTPYCYQFNIANWYGYDQAAGNGNIWNGTASFSGTTMTVASTTSGALQVGASVNGVGAYNLIIASFGTYTTAAGTGTVILSSAATTESTESVSAALLRQWDSVVGSWFTPSNTDFSQPHTYGLLWITQAQGCSAYGYPGLGCLISFFDGIQLAAPVVWNACVTNALPPPVTNSSAMCSMDARHLYLRLGTGTDQPMTVYAVKVWQTSSANNLSY